jgi:hypothetical protein
MQPLFYQVDYINGLLETRRATDQFATKLVARNSTPSTMQKQLYTKDVPTVVSLKQKLQALLGASSSSATSVETTAPIAFTYSLYFVYYDQYTYIEGVLSQNVLLAVAGIIFALQVIMSNLTIIVVEQFGNRLHHYSVCVPDNA